MFGLIKPATKTDVVDRIRIQLSKGVRGGMTESEIAELHVVLMSLYAALGVTNVVSIIDKIDFKKVA